MTDLFPTELIEKLSAQLPPSAIKSRTAFGEGGKQLSYLEGWYVQDLLNKTFGFGNWSQEVTRLEKTAEYTVKKNDKTNTVVVWHATVKLEIRVQTSKEGEYAWVRREDVGVGVGEGMNIAAITEKTVKEAVTDAIKRAAKSFGNTFGLALYDKEQAGVMSPQEEQFQAMESIAGALIDIGDVVAVQTWFGNNRAGMATARRSYPELRERIDALGKTVLDFIDKNSKVPAGEASPASVSPDSPDAPQGGSPKIE